MNTPTKSAAEQQPKWTTENELEYLKGVGYWSDVSKRTRPPTRDRLWFLKNYLVSMRRRTHWGEINSVVIAVYLQSEISKLEKNRMN